MANTPSVIGTQNKKGQTFTDPWKMLHEAPRTPSFFTGSEVIKEAVRRASCDVMIAYPITPQSEAAALIGELFAEGYIGDYFRGESEFAVMSQCAGAAFGGAAAIAAAAIVKSTAIIAGRSPIVCSILSRHRPGRKP